MEKEVIEAYKKAGTITAQALAYGKKLIVPGATAVSVCDAVEEKIRSLGGEIAFPAQVAINSIAAHFCPEDDSVVFKEGDLIKLDCGTHIEGFVGDSAVTVDLGDHKKLVQASKDALHAALKLVRPEATLGELGRAIQETITAAGFTPIKNLSGHGLDQYEIHTQPSIPNFDTKDETPLGEGIAIAIEPFATTGQGWIYESSNPTIFSLLQPKPVRSPMTKQILQELLTYNGLPFTSRWLIKKFGVGKTRFALRELKMNGSLHEHPPLPEKAEGLVSQAEHTVLVFDKPIITTQLDD